jgi:Uma2 family endonuclease
LPLAKKFGLKETRAGGLDFSRSIVLRLKPTGDAMSSAASKDVPRFTPEQYLAVERKAQFKSEFHNGFIEAMAGATREHNLIVGNLFSEIRARFKGRLCEVYTSGMRVWVGPARRYTYPNVVAVCGKREFQDSERDTLLNPMMIVEVLSPSTEKLDRGRKFADYRRLESLREYVIIDQEQVLVERYTRHGHQWLRTELNRLDDFLRLASIDCEVPLREIYARVLPLEDNPLEA